ncbi:hypothetical protein CCP3SC15_3550001 [Gammaproteobacteria bacterium]
MESDFFYYVRRFEEEKHRHGRRNMLHYHFLLHKIFTQRGFLAAAEKMVKKLPKLKKTVDKLEIIWIMIQ